MMRLMSDQIHSSSLYINSSFLRGIARVADLYGAMNQSDTYNTQEFPDYEAIKRDWEVIGLDLYGGIKQYQEESGLAEE